MKRSSFIMLTAVALLVASAIPASAARDAGAKARGDFSSRPGAGVGARAFSAQTYQRAAPYTYAAPLETRQSFSYAPGAAQLQPGSTVVVVVPGAPLKVGSQLVATVPQGQSLTVSRVQGPWLWTTVELNGQSRSGWIASSSVSAHAAAASGTQPAAAPAAQRAPCH